MQSGEKNLNTCRLMLIRLYVKHHRLDESITQTRKNGRPCHSLPFCIKLMTYGLSAAVIPGIDYETLVISIVRVASS